MAFGGKLDEKSGGYFINPTINSDPSDDSRIVVEEPFGTLPHPFVKLR